MRSLRAILARARKHRSILIGLGIVLLLGVLHGPTLVAHARLSGDRYVFADDARILIYPQFRRVDAMLFPRDPTVDYYLASLPDGYSLLYRLLGPIVGVVALSKALPYVLFACTLGFLGLSAWRLGGGAAALGTLSLAIGSEFLLGRQIGGLPRGFAAPLLAGGAFALVHGRARLLAALTVVAASTYPVAGLTLGAALAWLLALPPSSRGCTASWPLRKRALLLAGTAAVAALVLVPSTVRLHEWGRAIGPSLVAAYPEAGALGRFNPGDRPPFPAFHIAALEPLRLSVVGSGPALVGALDARTHATWLVPTLVLVACAGVGWRAVRQVEARRFLLLPLAVAVCHTLALLLAPRLFLPERYVAYAIPISALILVPAALGALHGAEKRWLRMLPWTYVGALLVALGAHGVPWSGLSVHVPAAERPLHAAIAQLPKSAVIAGFPSETNDNVPYLTRRSVFLARETHMPFHTRYTDLMRERARALFAAYFASDLRALRDFRDRHGVTHLLLDRRHFVTRPTYFAPFDADVARAFDAGKEGGFAALALGAGARVAEVGDFVLVELGRI